MKDKKMSKKERKEKAIEIMKKLDIYKPYIEGFEKNNDVCYYEGVGAGFWAWQDKELEKKIKEIEQKYDCTVYAVTHEYTEFGELYDFLLVTSDKEDWDFLLSESKDDNTYIVFSYVWNKSDEYCSELGSIGIATFGGGIRRVM